MNGKILIAFMVVCLAVAAEAKKGIKCKGFICRRTSGSNESGEDNYEKCDDFCERREREKQRALDEEQACSSRRGRGKGNGNGRNRCRGGSRHRNGSKERQNERQEKMREKDCECEEKKMVCRKYFQKRFHFFNNLNNLEFNNYFNNTKHDNN